MIIPLPSDNYIVAGPGRTGSKVIVDTIMKICRQLAIFTEIKNPELVIEIIEPGKIYHTHQWHYLQHSQAVIKCILSIRDLIDSSLSWCIQPYIGEWHLYPLKHRELRTRLEENIPAFYLDPMRFIHYYESAKTFYQEAGKYDLSDVVIVDYSIFQNDHTNIAKILDYPLFPIRGLPVKNPGIPEQWITNWDEIEKIIKGLERNPLTFLKG
jgi:hypothetical protein